jgi:adenosylhomocysteine nucleosidase
VAQDADVVVLTALDLEAVPFRRLLAGARDVEGRHRRYLRGEIDDRLVVVWPVLGAGNVRAAIAAQQAIAVWNPAYILLSGITGGIATPGVELGDVLVPQQVVAYEPGKVRDDKVESRFEVYRPSHYVLKAAAIAQKSDWTASISERAPGKQKRPPTVHFQDMASGEKVIASKQWGKAFKEKWPRLTGVEMESLGILESAYRADEAPQAGVIKSVSDWADRHKGDDWQPYSAATAAAFVVAVIRALVVPSQRPQPQRVGSSLSSHVPKEVKKGWGPKKVQMCRGLDQTEQRELADCLEVEPHIKDRFDKVAYCSAIWDYFQRNDKLSELPGVLKDCLGREDLVSLIEDYC